MKLYRCANTLEHHVQGSRVGDKGSGHPPPPHTHTEKSHNLGFLSNIGPDPLKNNKASKPAFNVVKVGPPLTELS